MRNTQLTSTKGTAFLTQRILPALDTFSEQPNHQVFPICFGLSHLFVRSHLFTFPIKMPPLWHFLVIIPRQKIFPTKKRFQISSRLLFLSILGD